MSYLNRPESRSEAQDEQDEQDTSGETPRSPFAEYAGRFANWVTGADRLPPGPVRAAHESGEAPVRGPAASPPVTDETTRFPVAALGYNRAAVDEHLMGLERELAEMRAERPEPPISVTEELERIGEQTASILVVAHDKAHETTRLAQEQAERCVSDAAANAVAITAQAQERLRELDGETDSVWRERERLLEDIRVVSASLATLADEASERFPAAEQVSGPQRTQAFQMVRDSEQTQAFPIAMGIDQETANGRRGTSQAQDSEFEETQPGDTGSWLTGLEPPDQQGQ
jgi:DivIVA protein